MSVLVNYARYRKLQLRNAALLAGVDRVLIPFAKGVGIAALALICYATVSGSVEAGQHAADNRIAARLAAQATHIKALEAIVTKCTAPGDNTLIVDGEVWFCGATNTGIKVRP